MINKNTAKSTMKTPIKTVVPHPGNTFPDSEFNGLNKVPKGVTIPGSCDESEKLDLAFEVVPVAIFYFKYILIFFTFCHNIIIGE